MDYVFEVTMMSDLISRSWMMEQLDGLGDTRLIKRNFIALVTNAQTVDAVEVVRCRECKHWKPSGSKAGNSFSDMEYIGGCEFANYYRSESDFCSYGERKDGGHDG